MVGLKLRKLTCDRYAIFETRRTGCRDILAALYKVRFEHHTHYVLGGIAGLQLPRLMQIEDAFVEMFRCKLTMSSATSICRWCCFWLFPWLQSIYWAR